MIGEFTNGAKKFAHGQKLNKEEVTAFEQIAAIVLGIIVLGAFLQMDVMPTIFGRNTNTENPADIQNGNPGDEQRLLTSSNIEEDIMDQYGRKVSPTNTLWMGTVIPESDPFKDPPVLVKKGVEIAVGFKGDTLSVKALKTPDPKKTQTVIRVKLFNQNGLVKLKENFYPESARKYTGEFIEMAIIGREKEPGERGFIIRDDSLVNPPLGTIKKMEVLVYFIDANTIPTPPPQQKIYV